MKFYAPAIDSRRGKGYSIAGSRLPRKMAAVRLSREVCLLKELLSLFLTFAKVGVMTFGGGYAMLPILQREVVENKGWATDEELTDSGWYHLLGEVIEQALAIVKDAESAIG